MRNVFYILRQARRASQQAILFVFCTALSLTAITAFSGFSNAVERAMRDDARTFNGADIIISSYDPIPIPLQQSIDRIVEAHQTSRATVHRFFSMVASSRTGNSVLAAIKTVSDAYPLYGAVNTASGTPFQNTLAPGAVVVAQALLDRLEARVGDRLVIGAKSLVVADIVLSEPDRAINALNFAPRVFIHDDDLEGLNLIQTGSRVRRTVLVKMPPDAPLEPVAAQLRETAGDTQQVRIDTYATAGSRIKRFLDNIFFFLRLVGLFILVLAGIGMQGTLTALLNEKQRTIAIMKTVGANNRTITVHFVGLLVVLGLLGTAIGIACGIGLQHLLGRTMAPFLPNDLAVSISWRGILEGICLGAGVIALFSFLPMVRIKEMRPMLLFRGNGARIRSKWPYVLFWLLFTGSFFGLVLWQMRDLRFGTIFVAGIGGLIVIAALLSSAGLWIIARLSPRHLATRQAIRGLFRQAAATRAVIVTLTVSLAIIFTNVLIEQNMDENFVQSYPQNAPNLFFVDIQPHQRTEFIAMMGPRTQLYPIVRARITAVNGQTIDREQERRKRRDNLSRVFNLTYRDTLLEDEIIIQGDQLFDPDLGSQQVSVLDTVVGMRAMSIGDTLEFKIQGVPLEARISSIRSRTQSTFRPFFYFVFPPAFLQQAPHTLFAALSVPPEQISTIQRRTFERFPNISVIDMSQTISMFAGLMNRLSRIVRMFSLISITAGLLILISTVYATRAQRMLESVYYQVIGARKAFVFSVFALEHCLIGLLSGLLALLMAQSCAYWVCQVTLDIAYRPQYLESVAMVTATLAVVTAVGLAASRSIMKKKPVVYLREQSNG